MVVSPPQTGPRKYKRRRKLKPHELEHHARAARKNDTDYSDDEEDLSRAAAAAKSTASGPDDDPLDEPDDYADYSSATTAKSSSRQRTLVDPVRRREKKNSFSAALDERFFSNVENTLQNIDSLVIPSGSNSSSNHQKPTKTTTATSSSTVKPAASKKRAAAASSSSSKKEPPRPKMIHTQKTRVPVEDNGKRKTKTLITRTTPHQHDSPTTGASTSRSRRKTTAAAAKHKLPEVKIENESNGDDFMNKPLSETEILLKLSRQNNAKYNPDVFNDLEDILRSPIKVARTPNTGNDDFEVPASSSSGSLRFTTTAMFPERDFYLSPARLRLESGSGEDDDGDETESGNETEQHHSRLVDNAPVDHNPKSETESDANPMDDDSESSSENDDEDHMGLRIKQEVSNDDEYILGAHSSIGNNGTTQGYTCEMCAEVFGDRAQLLLHVPIHI